MMSTFLMRRCCHIDCLDSAPTCVCGFVSVLHACRAARERTQSRMAVLDSSVRFLQGMLATRSPKRLGAWPEISEMWIRHLLWQAPCSSQLSCFQALE